MNELKYFLVLDAGFICVNWKKCLYTKWWFELLLYDIKVWNKEKLSWMLIGYHVIT